MVLVNLLPPTFIARTTAGREDRSTQRRAAEDVGAAPRRASGGALKGFKLGKIMVKIMVKYIIWVNYNDLTATSPEIIVSKGNHPQMAARFRLVKYYNLPRYNG